MILKCRGISFQFSCYLMRMAQIALPLYLIGGIEKRCGYIYLNIYFLVWRFTIAFWPTNVNQFPEY